MAYFRRLQSLVAIADHGSFTAAAIALRTVQSSISANVARLENELGVLLVDRRTGKLTEEGQAVVERARRISAELDAILSDLSAMNPKVTGPPRSAVGFADDYSEG